MAAQSVEEKLLLAMKGREAGWTVTGQDCESISRTTTDPEFKITCEVIGRTNAQVEGMYVVPTPGTGNVKTICNPNNYLTDLDDPCNWSKLKFGNSYESRIVVPLYYEFDPGTESDQCGTDDGSNDNICNFAEADHEGGAADLKVRIQTPCRSYNEAGICINRPILDVPALSTDENETLVSWEIAGTCEDTNTGKMEPCSLRAVNTVDDFHIRRSENSEIYESLINTTYNSIVLDLSSNGDWGKDLRKTFDPTPNPGEEPYISDFLSNEGIWSNQILHKPVLKLTFIAHQLHDDAEDKIPNLEYQIISTRPVSTSKKTLEIQVQYKGQAYKIKNSIEQKKDVIDFAIQN